jgi:predicted transcriptional regulator
MSARPARVTLQADTAADLMSENPVSLRQEATISEAIVLLADRGFRIAPVIDECGRPIGVISVTDIFIHERESISSHKSSISSCHVECQSWTSESSKPSVGVVDGVTVSDVMTPGVITVRRNTLVGEVIQTMKSENVHQLFVADDDGVFVGVISSGDILRKLTLDCSCNHPRISSHGTTD